MAQGSTKGIPIDTDNTLSANSNLLVSSQNAVKTYVDAKITQTITSGVITTAPSEDAVFNALALKSNIASPTFTGTVTTPAIIVSSETASTIASFDASKNIKSLDTVTYPSLTELAYGKGVTSAIQTQLNSRVKIIIKNSTLSAGITGTLAETIISSTLIPANSFAVNDIMQLVSCRFSKTGSAGTVTYKMYINTTSSLTGATQVGTFTGVGIYFKAGARTYTLRGGSFIGVSFASAGIASGGDIGSTSASINSTAFNTTVDNYLIFSATLAATGDTAFQSELYVTN